MLKQHVVGMTNATHSEMCIGKGIKMMTEMVKECLMKLFLKES
jgi:hypothetical protein